MAKPPAAQSEPPMGSAVRSRRLPSRFFAFHCSAAISQHSTVPIANPNAWSVRYGTGKSIGRFSASAIYTSLSVAHRTVCSESGAQPRNFRRWYGSLLERHKTQLSLLFRRWTRCGFIFAPRLFGLTGFGVYIAEQYMQGINRTLV